MRRFGKDLRQQAVMAGIEVLNQDEGQAGIYRQHMKEFFVRFESACRGSNRYYGKEWLGGLALFLADILFDDEVDLDTFGFTFALPFSFGAP